jgi:hypothetical protein
MFFGIMLISMLHGRTVRGWAENFASVIFFIREMKTG